MFWKGLKNGRKMLECISSEIKIRKNNFDAKSVRFNYCQLMEILRPFNCRCRWLHRRSNWTVALAVNTNREPFRDCHRVVSLGLRVTQINFTSTTAVLLQSEAAGKSTVWWPSSDNCHRENWYWMVQPSKSRLTLCRNRNAQAFNFTSLIPGDISQRTANFNSLSI